MIQDLLILDYETKRFYSNRTLSRSSHHHIQKEFIGGCDIVKEMYESGELAKLFEAKGINFKVKN